MNPLEINDLASTAATAIVTLMTTGTATVTWRRVRQKLPTLWRHSRPEQVAVISAELDRAQAGLGVAAPGDRLTIEEAVTGRLAAHLQILLEEDPSTADHLKQLVSDPDDFASMKVYGDYIQLDVSGGIGIGKVGGNVDLRGGAREKGPL